MNDDRPAVDQLLERVAQLEKRVQELDREATVGEQKQRDAHQRLRMEQFLSEMGAALLELTIDQVDEGITTWLGRIGELIDTDRVTLFRHYSQERCLRVTRSWERPGVLPPPSVIYYDQTPWAVREILAGRIVRAERLEELPPEASTDVAFFEEYGNLGGLMIPLKVRGSVIGAAVVASVRSERKWPEGLVQWLNVASQMFANLLIWVESESELEETRSLLMAAVEQSPAGILIADAPDVRIRLANPAALGIRGESDAPLTEIPVKMHPSHWQTFREDGTMFKPEELPLSRAVLEGKTSQNVVARIRRADGSDRWVLANAAPVRDASGEIVAGVVVFPDVTEAIKAHEALQTSEEKYRTLFEAAADAILMMDGLTFVQCSETTLKMFGCQSMDQIIGHTPIDFSPSVQPDGQASDQKARALFETAYGGEPRRFYWQHLRKDGQPFDAEVSLNALGVKGKGLLLAIVRDITERKRSELALRESEERFRTLIQSVANVILFLSPDHRILEFNSEAERVYGRKRDEVLGQNYVESFLPEEVRGAVAQDIGKVLGGEPSFGFESAVVSPERGVRTFRWDVNRVLDSAGEPIGVVAVGSDITDRKQAEEALRRYERIVSSSNDMLALLDENFVYLATNERYVSAFGKTRSELVGSTVSETFGDTLFETVVRPNAEKCLQGHEVRYQEWFDFPTLGKRYMEITYDPYRGPDNEIMGFAVNGRDITERKRAEEALRESEETIRAMVETSKDWIWSIDVHGTHTFCNPAVKTILGYSPSDIIGKPCWKYMHPEDRQGIEADLAKWVAKGQGWNNLLVRWRHKDGSWRYLESNAVPILDSDNQVIGFRGVDRDITERQQNEQALRESQERYQRLAEATHEGIGMSDRGAILDVNQQLARMLGYRREEMLGMKVADMVAPESREAVQKHLAAGRDDAYEHLAVKKDGTVIPVEVRAKTIPLEGRVVRVTAVRDLTEQKKAEASLKDAAAEIEAKHQALTEKHVTLKQVLEHMEQERFDFKHELSANIEHALTPFVQKLRSSDGTISQTDLDLLEDTVMFLSGSDLDVFANNYEKLTPRERDICDRIREGLSSKEIAEDLNVTLQTIEKHRASIRKKLQIKHKKVNLASYLRSR